MSTNTDDPVNSSSKNNENESALHIFKDFLVLDTYESTKYVGPHGSSPIPRIGKVNEVAKFREQKIIKKNEHVKGKKEEGKANEKVNIGERRDPEKTKRDIEKDKFNKKTEDIVKKLESGLVPPGMETEVLVKPDPLKSLESLSATESISPKNTITGDNQKANKVNLDLEVQKERVVNNSQIQTFWKKESPEMKYESPVWTKPHIKMLRPSPNATFPFRQWGKSPVGCARFPDRFAREGSPKRSPKSRSPNRFQGSRSPNRFPRSRSPNRFQGSRSPNRFPRSRSPNRFQGSRSPNRFPRSRSPNRFRGLRSPNRFPRSRSPNRFPRLRSPNRFQRQGQIRRSPIRKSHSRERESNNRRPPNLRVSRRRSTERFIKELIKTSGIQEGTASPNVSQEFSNPEAPMMLPEFPPLMFDCGPPPMAFPPFNHPREFNPNMIPPDESIFYPNATNLNSFNAPPPIFPPIPYPTNAFPAGAAPETPVYFPPPLMPQEPVGYNPAINANAVQKLLKEVKLQKTAISIIPELMGKTFPMSIKIKAEIISRCQEAVLKLDSLHFPNRLFSPPSEHAVFNIHQSVKASPLRRQLPPNFSFTSKPNDSGAILLPSIISTIGLDETISSMALPPPSFTPTGQTKKNAYCQTDDYYCNYCIIRKDTPTLHKSTMTIRASVSVHCQVTNEDLRSSQIIFTPNQTEAPLQEKPVSLMHLTPAQILVAELTAKAKNLQRSTVEAAQRAKQDQMGQSGSRVGQPITGRLKGEQHDGDSYGYKHRQNQSQVRRSNNQDSEQRYKEDKRTGGYALQRKARHRRVSGERFPKGQGPSHDQEKGYQQDQGPSHDQAKNEGYDQDDNYGSGRKQSQSKLTREYDEFLQRIQSEKPPKRSGNRRNNAPY